MAVPGPDAVTDVVESAIERFQDENQSESGLPEFEFDLGELFEFEGASQGECPVDQTMALLGKNVVFEASALCDVLRTLGYLVLAAAAIMAARIVIS